MIKSVLRLPIKAVNMVIGGNKVDAFRKSKNTVLKHAKNSKTIDTVVNKFGDAKDKALLKKETRKTYAARAVVGAGLTAEAYRRSKEKQKTKARAHALAEQYRQHYQGY